MRTGTPESVSGRTYAYEEVGGTQDDDRATYGRVDELTRTNS